LAEFRVITPAISRLTYLPWPNVINRNDPICVASPNVAKARTVP